MLGHFQVIELSCDWVGVVTIKRFFARVQSFENKMYKTKIGGIKLHRDFYIEFGLSQ